MKCFRPQCKHEAVHVVLLREAGYDGNFSTLQYCQRCYEMMTELWSGSWQMLDGMRALKWEDLPSDTLSVMETHQS